MQENRKGPTRILRQGGIFIITLIPNVSKPPKFLASAQTPSNTRLTVSKTKAWLTKLRADACSLTDPSLCWTPKNTLGGFKEVERLRSTKENFIIYKLYQGSRAIIFQTCKRASKDAKVLRGSDSSPHLAWQPTWGSGSPGSAQLPGEQKQQAGPVKPTFKMLPIPDAKRLTNVHSPSKVVEANTKWL